MKRPAAELIGTGSLVAAVVGSGIMATQLTSDLGLALLINAVATVAALGVLIWTLGPISGAHFNPAVTMIALLRKEMPPREAGSYVLAQLVGAFLGVALANVMFDLPAWHLSTTDRVEVGTLLGEVVATAGLLALIGSVRSEERRVGKECRPLCRSRWSPYH